MRRTEKRRSGGEEEKANSNCFLGYYENTFNNAKYPTHPTKKKVVKNTPIKKKKRLDIHLVQKEDPDYGKVVAQDIQQL